MPGTADHGCLEAHIGIVDRHPIFRAALAGLIRTELPEVRLAELSALELLSPGQAGLRLPQVLLLDMQLPGLGGLAGLLQLACSNLGTHFIVVCDDLPAEPQQLLRHGAMAGISKAAAPEQFIEAIHAVLHGRCWLPARNLEHPFCDLGGRSHQEDRYARLSPRRQLIVHMIADGRLNKQIAHELGLCESTIKAHVSQIMKILHVRNRTQIAMTLGRRGDPPAPVPRAEVPRLTLPLPASQPSLDRHVL